MDEMTLESVDLERSEDLINWEPVPTADALHRLGNAYEDLEPVIAEILKGSTVNTPWVFYRKVTA